MESKNVIAGLRQLWAASESRCWNGQTTLNVVLTRPVAFELLRDLSAADLIATCDDPAVQRALDTNRSGEAAARANITLHVPRTVDRLVVAEDLKDLLSLPRAQTQEPAAYVLVATRSNGAFFEHTCGDDLTAAPPDVRRYHDAIRLWRILEQRAQHHDSATGSLLFFGIRRTEVSPGFSIADLTDDVSTQQIEDFVNNEDGKATRAEIFASALSEFLRDHGAATCFTALLRGSSRFARRLNEGLAIYLAEHSPEKLAEEARTAGLGLSEKLEKIISGLETKSLSIPVALLLAVKDVEQGGGFTAINAVIVAAALTYGATMTLVDQSQRALLSLLKTTIAATEKDLMSKGLSETNPVLKTTYQTLKNRCAAATKGSLLMCFASWTPLVCVITAVVFGTPKPTAPVLSVAPIGATVKPQPAQTPVPQDSLPVIRLVIPTAPHSGSEPQSTATPH